MHDTPKLLAVVALLDDLPTYGLRRGQGGTIVEALAPDVFEVEFNEDQGRAYVLLALRTHLMIILHYEPALAA